MRPDEFVVLHHNDEDGYCAAWAAARFLPEGTVLIPVDYGQQPPPGLDGKHVLIVDFSYPRATLMAMAGRVASLEVIDHHASARVALDGFEREGGTLCPTRVTFDMARSGAVLTFDVLAERHDGTASAGGSLYRPVLSPGEYAAMSTLCAYVQDRDLWAWKLPDSRAINNVIAATPWTFEAWDALASLLAEDYGSVVADGDAIEGYKLKLARDCVAQTRVDAVIAGALVPCLNTQILRSESMEAIVLGNTPPPFVAYFYLRSDRLYVFGLRSVDKDFDVSAVAKQYGGGGHKNAAGFEVAGIQFDQDGRLHPYPVVAASATPA